ncbi:MAG: 30S ribosomal protein S6 [Acidobacteriota bacterium]|nr:30S ribosomal protein S6 [Acidobacteriota bacterium]
MKQYETGFIMAPNLSEEDAETFITQMTEIIDQKNGRMIKKDIWGKRRLAYPIKKFQEGLYVFFHYEGGGDISQELERRFKQSEAVIRFLTVIKDPRDPLRKKKKDRPSEDRAAETTESVPTEAVPAETASGSEAPAETGEKTEESTDVEG